MRRPSYDAYLRGEHWREFRAGILRSRPQCRICWGMATVVHHKTYDRIGGELPADVEALCDECHNALHVVHREARIPLEEFGRAAAMVRPLARRRRSARKARLNLGPGRRRRPKLPAPPPPPVVRPDTPLADRAPEIRRMLVAGHRPKQIAKARRWPTAEVKAVVAWIVATTENPKDAEWLRQLSK